MNKFIFVLAILGTPLMAESYFCSSRGNQATVLISGTTQTAVVRFSNVVAKFGRLKCEYVSSDKRRRERLVMQCHSNIADAGYAVALYKNRATGRSRAELESVSFIGSRRIAELECAYAP